MLNDFRRTCELASIVAKTPHQRGADRGSGTVLDREFSRWQSVGIILTLMFQNYTNVTGENLRGLLNDSIQLCANLTENCTCQSCLSVCLFLICGLESRGFAQYEEIHLADMPSPVAYGAVYHISGTTENIPEGTEIHILVRVDWFSVITYSQDWYEIELNVTVDGSSFQGGPIPFYGPGTYFVSATQLNGSGYDYEYGAISGP